MSHAAIRCRRSWPSGDSRYVIRSESIRLIVFSSRTRQGYQRNPSASTMMEEVSQPWSHVIRLKYPSGEMMTPGYFFFISSPTRDMDQRSGRWSFVFFRWTAHMTTALTPASWHRRIFSSSADVVLRHDDLDRDDGAPFRVLLELVVHVQVLVSL